MTILKEDDAKAILKKVVGFSKADGCQATLAGSREGNIRYARNTVSTSGVVDDMTLSVQSNFGKKQGTATVNEFDDASLEKVVRRAEELARLAPENPEFEEILGPQGAYADGKAWFESTAGIDPAYRAEAAGGSIAAAKASKAVAAGFLTDSAGFRALMNSKGLFGHYASTQANFTVTMRTEDDLGSGWAMGDVDDVARLNTGDLSRVAVEKALGSRAAKAIEPGKYTVILEPAASIALLSFMFGGLDARQADEGRSFLSKKGGGTKLGEKIVDERVSFYSDPTDAAVPVQGWANDGQRCDKVTWIENGVVKALPTSRYWARKQGTKPIPGPNNLLMKGGSGTTADLIRDTQRGILVTRTWYIRSVDPQTVLVTGLTRDGTFFIENGKISFPIKNMRFNESPVIMLNNLEAMGVPQRVSGQGLSNAMVPPMRLRDFTFSSLSDAV